MQMERITPAVEIVDILNVAIGGILKGSNGLYKKVKVTWGVSLVENALKK